MSIVSYPHIEIRENGKAYIQGTGFKVRILVEEYLSGMPPQDIERQHPPLTLSQIHGALTYYYDHKDQIDKEVEELDRLEQELRPRLENSTVVDKLRQAMKDRKGQK
jgi:uncharacterized protein (DUF433 family)